MFWRGGWRLEGLPPFHHPSHHPCPSSVWCRGGWRGPFQHSTTSVHKCGGGAPSSTPPPLSISVVQGPLPPLHHLCSSVWWRAPFQHSTIHHTTSVRQCGGGHPSSTPPPISISVVSGGWKGPFQHSTTHHTTSVHQCGVGEGGGLYAYFPQSHTSF